MVGAVKALGAPRGLGRQEARHNHSLGTRLALLQLVRFVAGWQITLNGAPVPLWLCGLVAVLAASLAMILAGAVAVTTRQEPLARSGNTAGPSEARLAGAS